MKKLNLFLCFLICIVSIFNYNCVYASDYTNLYNNETLKAISDIIGTEKSEISFKNINQEDKNLIYSKLIDYLNRTNPYSGYVKGFSTINNPWGFTVKPIYNIDINQMLKEIHITEEIIDEFIRDHITNNLTDVEKIKLAHDFVLSNTRYHNGDTTVYYEKVPYGVLSMHEATCLGYAKTLQAILNKLGYENITIIGNAISNDQSVGHAWNLVKINDKWYHIDPTWNDTDDIDLETSSFSNVKTDVAYYLNTMYNYKYFLVDDETIKDTHIWDYDFYPSATDNMLNTAIKNNAETIRLNILKKNNLITSYKDLEKLIKSNMDKDSFIFTVKDKSRFTMDDLYVFVEKTLRKSKIKAFKIDTLYLSSDSIAFYKVTLYRKS